jgi:hypothetical protein
MSQKTPLNIVKETFGAKDKLVDKLVGLLDRGEESKDDLRQRLTSAANSKLLHLHQVSTTVKEKYGSHDKLVTAVAAALGRSKDKVFIASLSGYSDSRLLDLAQAAQRRTKKAAAKSSKSAK